MAVGQRQLGTLDLPLPGLAAKLDHSLHDRREVEQVHAGVEAAVSVDGNAAARCYGAALDEGSTFALLAETVVLQVEDDLGREAVVELGEVDVAEPDPRFFERFPRREGPIDLGVVRLLPPLLAGLVARCYNSGTSSDYWGDSR